MPYGSTDAYKKHHGKKPPQGSLGGGGGGGGGRKSSPSVAPAAISAGIAAGTAGVVGATGSAPTGGSSTPKAPKTPKALKPTKVKLPTTKYQSLTKDYTAKDQRQIQARDYKAKETADLIRKHYELDDKGKPVVKKQQVPIPKKGKSSKDVARAMSRLDTQLSKTKARVPKNHWPKAKQTLTQIALQKVYKTDKKGAVVTEKKRLPVLKTSPEALQRGLTQMKRGTRKIRKGKKTFTPSDAFKGEKVSSEADTEGWLESAAKDSVSPALKSMGLPDLEGIGTMKTGLGKALETAPGQVVTGLLSQFMRPGAATRSFVGKSLAGGYGEGLAPPAWSPLRIKGKEAERINEAPGPLESFKYGDQTSPKLVWGHDIAEGVGLPKQTGIGFDLALDPLWFGPSFGAKAANSSMRAAILEEAIARQAPDILKAPRYARIAAVARRTGDTKPIEKYLTDAAKARGVKLASRKKPLSYYKLRKAAKENVAKGLEKENAELLGEIKRVLERSPEIQGHRYTPPGRLAADAVGRATRSHMRNRQIAPGFRVKATSPLGHEWAGIDIPLPKKFPLPTGGGRIGRFSAFKGELANTREAAAKMLPTMQKLDNELNDLTALRKAAKNAGEDARVIDLDHQIAAKLDEVNATRHYFKSEAGGEGVRALPRMETLGDLITRKNQQRMTHEAGRMASNMSRVMSQDAQQHLARIVKPIINDDKANLRVWLHQMMKQDRGDTALLDEFLPLSDTERQVVDDLSEFSKVQAAHGMEAGTIENELANYATRIVHKGKVLESAKNNPVREASTSLGGQMSGDIFAARHRSAPEMASLADPEKLTQALWLASDKKMPMVTAKKIADDWFKTGTVRANSELLARQIQRQGPVLFDDLTPMQQRAVRWGAMQKDKDQPLFTVHARGVDPETGEELSAAVDLGPGAKSQGFDAPHEVFEGLTDTEQIAAQVRSLEDDMQFVKDTIKTFGKGSEIAKQWRKVAKQLKAEYDEAMEFAPHGQVKAVKERMRAAARKVTVDHDEVAILKRNVAYFESEIEKLTQRIKSMPKPDAAKVKEAKAQIKELQAQVDELTNREDALIKELEALADQPERIELEWEKIQTGHWEAPLDDGSRVVIRQQRAANRNVWDISRMDSEGAWRPYAQSQPTLKDAQATVESKLNPEVSRRSEDMIRAEIFRIQEEAAPLVDRIMSYEDDIRYQDMNKAKAERLNLYKQRKAEIEKLESTRRRLSAQSGVVTRARNELAALEDAQEVPSHLAGLGRKSDKDYTGRLPDSRQNELWYETDVATSNYLRTQVEAIKTSFNARWRGLDQTVGVDLADAMGKVGTLGSGKRIQVSDLRPRYQDGELAGYVYGKKFIRKEDIDFEGGFVPAAYKRDSNARDRTVEIWLDPQTGREYMRPIDFESGPYGQAIQEQIGADRLWPTDQLLEAKLDLMRQAGGPNASAWDALFDTGMEGAWQRFMQTYRYTVTTPWPAYHFRNAISDAFKSLQADAGVMMHPIEGYRLTKAAFGRNAVYKNGSWKLTGFPEMTTEEMLFMFDLFGIRSTQHLSEFMHLTETGKMPGKLRGSWLNPGPKGKLGKWMIEGGARREDVARMLTFRQRLRRNGGDVADAALYMVDHHFDYSDLQAWERKSVRNLFLFYTWYRRNIPRQLLELVKRPYFFSSVGNTYAELAMGGTPLNQDWSKIWNRLPDMTGPAKMRSLVPDYMRTALSGVTVPWNDHTATVAFAPPWGDLQMVSNLATDPTGQGLTGVTQLLNPGITMLLQMRGQDLITGRDFKDMEPTPDVVAGVLGSLGVPTTTLADGRSAIPWEYALIVRNTPFLGRGSSYLMPPTINEKSDTGLVTRGVGGFDPISYGLGLNMLMSPSQDREAEYKAKVYSDMVAEYWSPMSFQNSNLTPEEKNARQHEMRDKLRQMAEERNIPMWIQQQDQEGPEYKSTSDRPSPSRAGLSSTSSSDAKPGLGMSELPTLGSSSSSLPTLGSDAPTLQPPDRPTPEDPKLRVPKGVADKAQGEDPKWGLGPATGFAQSIADVVPSFEQLRQSLSEREMAAHATNTERPTSGKLASYRQEPAKQPKAKEHKAAQRAAAKIEKAHPELSGTAATIAGAAAKFGVDPAVLASIYGIETAFGTNTSDSTAGAQGPMQFMPATFDQYGVDGPDKDKSADIQSTEDAIYSAANYLAASGFKDDPRGAVFAYNHADWYVDDVMSGAEKFRSPLWDRAAKAKVSGPKPLTIGELFYDPGISIADGQQVDPIGGHGDHVHFGSSNPRDILRVAKMATSMGLDVRENPAFEQVDPVHTSGSMHYQDMSIGKKLQNSKLYRKSGASGSTVGQALDITGTPEQMMALNKKIAALGGGSTAAAPSSTGSYGVGSSSGAPVLTSSGAYGLPSGPGSEPLLRSPRQLARDMEIEALSPTEVAAALQERVAGTPADTSYGLEVPDLSSVDYSEADDIEALIEALRDRDVTLV